MLTRTKMICTIGPAVASYEKILQLIDAGMNVARLNFSHGTHAEHAKVIQFLKKAREERGVPLAIMLDTKGPEIRLGMIKGEQFPIAAGEQLLLVKTECLGDASRVQMTPPMAIDSLKVGMRVLIDDGYLITHVVEKREDGVVLEMQNPGQIKSQKGVNVPGVNIPLPAMTEQDVADIIFGCEQDIDIIAASFIRSADHVLKIKKLLSEQKKSEIIVVAKIENSTGVENFDEILKVADGIMVARGDLGVELPLQEVPWLQKEMIRKCHQAAKPVITATQMLESMIKNPRPTRAEVSDVANAIYDSTSAVMLSGETAVGQYPVETVKLMKSIVEEAEKGFKYRDFFEQESRHGFNDVSLSVALSSVKMAYSAQAKGIFCFTSSGFTARMVSRFRPKMPIVVLTHNNKVYQQMGLYWGVIPMAPFAAKDVHEAFEVASRFALQRGIVQPKDLVVVTAGDPFGIQGTTNMMLVKSID
jgi:pyruvate kinase